MKTFFKSRTAARNVVREQGGKFVDAGVSAPTGQRWTVEQAFKSKAEHARIAIKAQLDAGTTGRPALMDVLQKTVGLTFNGANTYLYSIKKELVAARIAAS